MAFIEPLLWVWGVETLVFVPLFIFGVWYENRVVEAAIVQR